VSRPAPARSASWIPAGTLLLFVGSGAMVFAAGRRWISGTVTEVGLPIVHVSLAGHAVTGAASYEIQEASNSDFTGATTQTVTASPVSFTHSATAGTQPFFYRVRAVAACDPQRKSDYSAVVRAVITPVRSARQAAERLASGQLAERMPVRGTDDLARLAVSMNYMASELQHRIRQLEELSRLQQRFVADVSHELRTPLTTVRLAADVLYDAHDGFPPLENRSAVLMRRELDRFEALLADLLEISRFDAGAAELTLDEQDLCELVRTEVDALRALAETRGVDLVVMAPEMSCAADIDQRRIGRVLRNLLTNAIEHGEGGPVEIEVAANQTAVAVTVRDHGVGFDVNDSNNVFERFWRADRARARSLGGTGLGLAIAMEDVRLHGGNLTAWGRPMRGAQFRVTIPRRHGIPIASSPLPLVPRDLPRRRPVAKSIGRAGQ